MHDLRLGPFDLLKLLGEGGQGRVWLAKHRQTSRRVAIKLPHTQPSEWPVFYRELRAVSALNHPNIIRVLDFGQVSEADAQVSQGRLLASQPYLVMEWVESGTALRLEMFSTWTSLKSCLLSLLDALAHAHAHER